MLEHAVRRIERHLDRRGLLGTRDDDLDLSGEGDPESNFASSAVSGQSPPAGPQWSSGLRPLRLSALAYDKPLCASLDGFTLHAATRAGGLDDQGREALLRYVLRRTAYGSFFRVLAGGYFQARKLDRSCTGPRGRSQRIQRSSPTSLLCR